MGLEKMFTKALSVLFFSSLLFLFSPFFAQASESSEKMEESAGIKINILEGHEKYALGIEELEDCINALCVNEFQNRPQRPVYTEVFKKEAEVVFKRDFLALFLEERELSFKLCSEEAKLKDDSLAQAIDEDIWAFTLAKNLTEDEILEILTPFVKSESELAPVRLVFEKMKPQAWMIDRANPEETARDIFERYQKQSFALQSYIREFYFNKKTPLNYETILLEHKNWVETISKEVLSGSATPVSYLLDLLELIDIPLFKESIKKVSYSQDFIKKHFYRCTSEGFLEKDDAKDPLEYYKKSFVKFFINAKSYDVESVVSQGRGILGVLEKIIPESERDEFFKENEIGFLVDSLKGRSEYLKNYNKRIKKRIEVLQSLKQNALPLLRGKDTPITYFEIDPKADWFFERVWQTYYFRAPESKKHYVTIEAQRAAMIANGVVSGDNPIIAHELGHYLSFALLGTKEKFPLTYKKFQKVAECVRLGDEEFHSIPSKASIMPHRDLNLFTNLTGAEDFADLIATFYSKEIETDYVEYCEAHPNQFLLFLYQLGSRIYCPDESHPCMMYRLLMFKKNFHGTIPLACSGILDKYSPGSVDKEGNLLSVEKDIPHSTKLRSCIHLLYENS